MDGRHRAKVNTKVSQRKWSSKVTKFKMRLESSQLDIKQSVMYISNSNRCQRTQPEVSKPEEASEQVRWTNKFNTYKTTTTSKRPKGARIREIARTHINGRYSSSLRVLIFIASCLGVIASFGAIQLTYSYQLANNLIANNLPPKFIASSLSSSSSASSEIVVRVKEGPASIGKLIYTLKGEDPDDDPLTFGVLGSMASDLLRIENVPGNQANVYLRKELDRETTESYQMVITLTDGKLGRGNWVEDINDNYPVFGPHKTAISIREDVKVPLVIESVEANDQDEGRFGQVIYKLEELDDGQQNRRSDSSVSPQYSSMFSIETIDGKGVISLISPLDYEQKALYQLKVIAIDRAVEQERLSAYTNILISVEDCPDNPPMFTFVPSITRIPENLPIGSPIVKVAAVDGDRGINNPIQYKIVSVNGQLSEDGHKSGAVADSSLFSIDQETGQISVAHELDREAALTSASGSVSSMRSQPGSYVIQVQASETIGGSEGPASEIVTTELTVILTDVNDELPTFDQATYFGEILENSASESLVSFISGPPTTTTAAATVTPNQIVSPLASAKVVDRDQGTNGTFTLHLEGGDQAQLFDIWPKEATNEANFMIKISSTAQTQLLDYEKNRIFKFNLVAREKYGLMRSTQAKMIVYLKDFNDNYPQFDSDLYRVEIPENAIRGMHICAVKATDIDSGNYGTAGIRYTELRGEKANKFKLDPISGVITLKTNEHGFDRETMSQHHLIVEARDGLGLGNRNTTQLMIILTDINDQRPKFLLDQYEAFIYENELDFQSPLQVQAIDNDAENTFNSKITYSIVGGDPQQNFTIDPQTGRIRVKSSLIMSNQQHDQQTEMGLNNLMSSAAESSLSSPPQSSQLAASGLDFEGIAQKRDDTRQFNLTIKATDSGSPEPLSGLTNVIILVYDKNDHAPVFSKSVYNKSIREDAREGSQVIQVLAQDGDHSPTNSRITYRISSGASDKFVIDSESGLISVANGANLDIDRASGGQKRTNYLLNVIAFDGSFGPNQKSSSALVNITIIDVNNKPPEFVTLGQAVAARNQILYSLAGSGHQTAPPTTTVSPSAGSMQQQLMVVYVNEDAPYGLVVTRVVAMDLDSGAELRYSINYARSEARNEDMALIDPIHIRDLFSIDPIDGTIKVAKPLDRELFDQVKLRLQVEDIAAQTPDQSAYTYLLIKVTDINDNRPMFKKPIYKAVINENSISGTSVITLTADDKDLNKTMRYSLEGSPEMMRLIRINPRSGEITVNDKIDRELYPMINVTVKAEDYGHPHSLTGTTQLLITVRDENDNNPIFLNTSQFLSITSANNYSSDSTIPIRNHNMNNQTHTIGSLSASATITTTISPRLRSLASQRSLAPLDTIMSNLPLLSPGSSVEVREDSPIGYQFAYVKAEDADVDNNGRVTYLIDATSSRGKFRIDRDTGILSVASQLDRETLKHYTLIIEACDNYDLGYSTGESRRAFTQVNIIITDINDNAPVISTNLKQLDPSLGSSSSGHQSSPSISPSYEDVINSPGPFELPLADCLFINEFQALNEPILTITAHDPDDPSTSNGKIDFAIVNNGNLPQNELFGLIPIQRSTRSTPVSSTERYDLSPAGGGGGGGGASTTVDSTSGFEDLTLSETYRTPVISRQEEAGSVSSMSELPNEMSNIMRRKRSEPTTSALDPSILGNFYAPSSRAQSIGSYSSLQTFSNSRGRQLLNPSLISRTTIPTPTTTTTTTDADGIVVQPDTAVVPQMLRNQAKAEAGEGQVQVVVIQSLREKVGNYSILIKASDRGHPSLSSAKLINICVQDVNNHEPVFLRPALNHTIRVMENATIGSFVTQIEATDADQGQNAELQYSLKPTNIQNNNNDWQSFKIDKLTGIITTAKLFNRQFKKYYTLRVEAKDFGKPTSLSNDIDINIMIVNSGQYQPEFDQQVQQLQFTENISPGIEWFNLIPTTNLDDDPALIHLPETVASGASVGAVLTGNSNNDNINNKRWLTNPCYFIIDSDDQEQVFHLDRYTHRLTNQKVIDREKKSNYTLLIQATNNCNKTPSMPSYTPRTMAGEGSSASKISTTSSNPIDDTTNQSNQFEYRSGSLITSPVRTKRSSSSSSSINSTETIPASAAMLSNPNGSLEENNNGPSTSGFNQNSIDSLLAADKSLLKVVIRIKDVNDNAPKFTQKVYTGGITTEADFGTTFMIVQAIDADADTNGQVVYSIVRPIKSRSTQSIPTNGGGKSKPDYIRQRRSASQAGHLQPNYKPPVTLVDKLQTINQNDDTNTDSAEGIINDIPMAEGDDLFVINPQSGEISLNFDPQKHMKGYFEFDILANDTDGLFDSAKVFIYLLRQDQRVKFVLRLTPQELRQRLNKFRSVFGNMTGAIVNIDSYKYYENHDGTVDKKKTSLYLHFVNPEDNTIIDVDKVLTMIDNNIEYLDELYKEFHVLSSEAAHLPLSSSALIDPIDQVRTGLLGISSFLALILVLVIVLCINQRTRYERQLKAATVSAFGSSPLHLDPDYHSQTNLPNTNLHSQDPNPIWMNGFDVEQDWLGGGGKETGCQAGGNEIIINHRKHNQQIQHQQQHQLNNDDYLSSENSDDLNSLSCMNSTQMHYNNTTTATPRDSLSSSHGRVSGSGSGSGSGSSSTTNDRQFLCNGRSQTPQQQQTQKSQISAARGNNIKKQELISVLKNGNGPKMTNELAQQQQSANNYKRSQLLTDTNITTHSTFGPYKEVTIYTEHPNNNQYSHGITNDQQQKQQLQRQSDGQVNKIASQFNAKQLLSSDAQKPISQQTFSTPNQQMMNSSIRPGQANMHQQKIMINANGTDVMNRGIIRGHQQQTCIKQQSASGTKVSISTKQQQIANQVDSVGDFESNLNKLSILNLETTEL